MKRMSCGACGHGQFEIYGEKDEGFGVLGIQARCTKCHSTTVIKPSVCLQLDWKEDEVTEGCLCFMEPN